MQTLTETILNTRLESRFFTDTQLSHLLAGTPQRRYHLVNRALKSGEIIRVRRGIYALSNKFGRFKGHPFTLAQTMMPSSYVSFESALSFHSWIPESVSVVASVSAERKGVTVEAEDFGSYSFHPLASQKGYHLELVERVVVQGQVALVATPIRALLDLICFRKLSWQGLDWLLESLRIDFELLDGVVRQNFDVLKLVYKHRRVREFIELLELALRRKE